MRLTKEQYEALLPFEAEFRYAKTSQCCILPHIKFLKALEIIYGKDWNTKISPFVRKHLKIYRLGLKSE